MQTFRFTGSYSINTHNSLKHKAISRFYLQLILYASFCAPYIKKQSCTLLYKYKEFSGVAVKVDENQDIDKAIADFKKVKGVTSVNKDGIMQLQ